MARARLCVVLGRDSDVTACLLSQILSLRGRTGLAAVTQRYAGGTAELLDRLDRAGCRYEVVGLPETRREELPLRADTAVILSCGTGEAAAQLAGRCSDAVLNLDDPDGPVSVTGDVRIWTFSERRDEADITAKNLRLPPFRTEFEAVTNQSICRISVPLSDGRGLYPGLAAAAAAMTFGVSVAESARRMRRAEPVPVGMISLGAGPFAAAGYFDPLPAALPGGMR